MSLFRIQEKTPEVYTSTSRDFQLIGRLYDCIINGIKFDTDSILDIINTDFIDSKLLKLLQTKLGFFSDKYIRDDDLRYVLKAFPFIIKNKGSLKGIEQAVSLFLKINGIKSAVRINVINNSLNDSYTVQIYLNTDFKDTTILDEIFRYILPTGYNVEYKFINDIGDLNLLLESKIGVNVVIIKDSLSSLVRGNYIEYKNPIENYLIGSVGETQVSSPYDITFMGILESAELLPNYMDDPREQSKSFNHIGEVYIIKSQKDRLVDGYLERGEIKYFIFTNNANDVSNESTKGWKEMQTSDSYRVYDSSFYGYYNVEEGIFYKNKKSGFLELENTIYSNPDIKITNNSTSPSSCSILANYDSVKYLFDYDYNYVWSSNGEEWIKYSMQNYGVEIIGDNLDDTVYIVPKDNLIIYREEDPQHNVKEAIWTTSLSYNNKFSWNSIILDKTIIDNYKNQANAIIEGTPLSANIISSKDNYVYNKNKSWYKYDNSWVEIKKFEITGDPNIGTASIKPIYIDNASIFVGNDNKTWQSEINQFSGPILFIFGLDTPTYPNENTLFIDKETNNGYKYNIEKYKFEEVMYFMKANKVYEISEDELYYMIENGLIKPAFKNSNTIFNDVYDNMFLL